MDQVTTGSNSGGIVIPEDAVANPSLVTQLNNDEELANTSKYVSKQCLELKESADRDPWKPEEEILTIVDNFYNIKVILLNSTNTKELNYLELCLTGKNIGLVVLGRNVDRHHEPNYICLALNSYCTIYVIDPKIKIYIDFLRNFIHSSKATIWTSQGLCDSDSLLNNYDIDLSKSSRCQDIQAMHAFLMHYFAYLPNSCLAPYPRYAVKKKGTKPNMESFETLVNTWLLVPEEDFYIPPEKYNHLTVQPLNLTAKNLILKRCIMVLPLARKLSDYFWAGDKELSNRFTRRFTLVPSDKLQEECINDHLAKQVIYLSEGFIDDDLNSDSSYSERDENVNLEAYAHLGIAL